MDDFMPLSSFVQGISQVQEIQPFFTYFQAFEFHFALCDFNTIAQRIPSYSTVKREEIALTFAVSDTVFLCNYRYFFYALCGM